MTGYDERREIAEAFALASTGRAQGSEHSMMCRLAGCEGASWRQLFRRLAELIDPDGAEAGCDRNALLSLADELDRGMRTWRLGT